MKTTLLFALLLGALPAARAQDAPPNRYTTAQPAAAERFEIKGMLVERHGSGPRALVLVPGLASGA